MSNLHLVKTSQPDGIVSVNETVFEHNLTVNANMSAIVAGPVTIPNITINGTLNAINDLNITTNLAIGTNGQLNLTG